MLLNNIDSKNIDQKTSQKELILLLIFPNHTRFINPLQPGVTYLYPSPPQKKKYQKN